MLIQRDSHKLCSGTHYHPTPWLNIIYHYSKKHRLSDSWCHKLSFFGLRKAKSPENTERQQLASYHWYHCQLCIHKLKARFNLKTNKLTSKYHREVCAKSVVNCVCECAHIIQHRDKIYTQSHNWQKREVSKV